MVQCTVQLASLCAKSSLYFHSPAKGAASASLKDGFVCLCVTGAARESFSCAMSAAVQNTRASPCAEHTLSPPSRGGSSPGRLFKGIAVRRASGPPSEESSFPPARVPSA
ncbi:hypothetical protein MATL_G00091110 [Megalops atlanticus]|uniref:Uncharacterized protein n=1 Tax=Megalops atlanticus TaxID=7932 RepID=A0A9D3Q917_MEGAT|nr:hypothetical protein MATL_G00091110 [Megalops atlanticus]